MDEFNLQRRIVRRLLKEKPGVQAGMESLLRDVIAAPNGDAWNAAAKINWTKGEAAFVKWFENLLKKHPIPRGTELLWFEAPSELNPARTSVSAYEKMGSADDSYGMEADRWWPITPDGYTLPAGLQDLPELERAFSAAGLKRDDFNDSQRRLFPAIYALSYAYVVLLVLNGLPKTSVLKRSEATGGVGVMVGWADGDFDRVGLLDQDGWSPFKVPKISQPPTSKELDPNSLSFNLDKYIKAGGNLEHRDKEHGATILMRSHFDDVKVIRKLLEAGADASAVDREGASVLHHFGACDIPILKLLLTAGAKANHRDQSGETVLDRVLDDGRCTVEHIELLRAAGAKPGKGRDPLMNLAGDGYIDRAVARKMIAYWIAQGYKINSRDRDGRTPLWIALQEHSLDWAWRSTKPMAAWDLISRHCAC